MTAPDSMVDHVRQAEAALEELTRAGWSFGDEPVSEGLYRVVTGLAASARMLVEVTGQLSTGLEARAERGGLHLDPHGEARYPSPGTAVADRLHLCQLPAPDNVVGSHAVEVDRRTFIVTNDPDELRRVAEVVTEAATGAAAFGAKAWLAPVIDTAAASLGIDPGSIRAMIPEMNMLGWLPELSQADYTPALIERFGQEIIDASEITDRETTWHFIIDPAYRHSWDRGPR